MWRHITKAQGNITSIVQKTKTSKILISLIDLSHELSDDQLSNQGCLEDPKEVENESENTNEVSEPESPSES